MCIQYFVSASAYALLWLVVVMPMIQNIYSWANKLGHGHADVLHVIVHPLTYIHIKSLLFNDSEVLTKLHAN
jgi:L-cystine uptake protein TcyP (sodium:dicarboxylate symporter family)